MDESYRLAGKRKRRYMRGSQETLSGPIELNLGWVGKGILDLPL